MSDRLFQFRNGETFIDGQRVQWAGPGMGWRSVADFSFRVGDIVTQGNGDRHVIEAINDAGDVLDLRCIVGCAWCEPGDIERNMASRFEHAGEIVEGSR